MIQAGRLSALGGASYLKKHRLKAAGRKKLIQCRKSDGNYLQLATQRRRSNFRKVNVLHGDKEWRDEHDVPLLALRLQ
jgi:hypothetical protein